MNTTPYKTRVIVTFYFVGGVISGFANIISSMDGIGTVFGDILTVVDVSGRVLTVVGVSGGIFFLLVGVVRLGLRIWAMLWEARRRGPAARCPWECNDPWLRLCAALMFPSEGRRWLDAIAESLRDFDEADHPAVLRSFRRTAVAVIVLSWMAVFMPSGAR